MYIIDLPVDKGQITIRDKTTTNDKHETAVTLEHFSKLEKRTLYSNRNKLLKYVQMKLTENGYSKQEPDCLSENSWGKQTSTTIRHSVSIRSIDNTIEVHLFYTILIDVNVFKNICPMEYHNDIDAFNNIEITEHNENAATYLLNNYFVRVIPCEPTDNLDVVVADFQSYFDNVVLPFEQIINSIHDVYNNYLATGGDIMLWHSEFELSYYYLLTKKYSLAQELLQRQLALWKRRYEQQNIFFDQSRNKNIFSQSDISDSKSLFNVRIQFFDVVVKSISKLVALYNPN